MRKGANTGEKKVNQVNLKQQKTKFRICFIFTIFVTINNNDM